MTNSLSRVAERRTFGCRSMEKSCSGAGYPIACVADVPLETEGRGGGQDKGVNKGLVVVGAVVRLVA